MLLPQDPMLAESRSGGRLSASVDLTQGTKQPFYPPGAKKPMTPLPTPNSLILVAVLNNLRDFEIARLLGWYRIPLNSAPKVVAVDYLAFYQTTAFGDEKWRIQTIAPVNGHELTTRAELLKDEMDHPRANQAYYKIQLGPLVRLPKPILADGWRRVTFFYTTGEYLLRAERLKDLVVESDERQLLWQSLRERANLAQQYGQPEPILPELDLDPGLLSLFLGIKELEAGFKPQKKDSDSDPLSG
jgi:hypothetical protein